VDDSWTIPVGSSGVNKALWKGREGLANLGSLAHRLRLPNVNRRRRELPVTDTLLDGERRIAPQRHPCCCCATKVMERERLAKLVVGEQDGPRHAGHPQVPTQLR
jgi:hypothetical protein